MKRSIRTILAAVLWLACASLSAHAQTVQEAVVSWDVEFFAQGVNTATGSPIQAATNFLLSTAACNQAFFAIPPASVLNPTVMQVSDPVNVGRACTLSNASAILMGVPIGAGYTATAKARGATTVSARSAASNPFDRAVVLVPPPVPAAVRVLP